MNATGKAGSLKADVVVIGSGGGLAAAVTAAEAGASVILLEKVHVLGGYTRLANALSACESPLQKRNNVTVTRDEVFRNIMDWNRWTRVNPRVARAYVNQTGETIEWLEKKGVVFELHAPLDGPPMGHLPEGMGDGLQKALAKSAEEVGVKILLNTSGKKILREPNGGITGVLAATKSGEEFQIDTKAVVIATGGFGNNRKLLKKYCFDYYDGMHIDMWPHRTAHSGDGLLMAEEIGAEIVGSVPNYHLGPYYPGCMYPWQTLATIAINFYPIWINKRGRRFINEAGPSNMLGGNAIMWQPDRVMYAVFDDKLREDVELGRASETVKGRKQSKAGGGTILVELEKGTPGLKEELQKQDKDKSGNTKIAESWDEIAAWIGARPEALKAEIEEYNSFCDKGHDEVFNKDKKYLRPLRTPPYYAMRCYARVGETMGGVRVNEHMEVLDTQGDVIPGAYVGCVLADGFTGFTSSAAAGVSVMGFAINSGRIAGRSAAKYALGK